MKAERSGPDQDVGVKDRRRRAVGIRRSAVGGEETTDTEERERTADRLGTADATPTRRTSQRLVPTNDTERTRHIRQAQCRLRASLQKRLLGGIPKRQASRPTNGGGNGGGCGRAVHPDIGCRGRARPYRRRQARRPPHYGSSLVPTAKRRQVAALQKRSGRASGSSLPTTQKRRCRWERQRFAALRMTTIVKKR
jgi:hypothetical protein